MSEPVYNFRDMPIVTDERLTPVLNHCPFDHTAFEAIPTPVINGMMLLAAQCPTCKRIFMLDEMRLP